MPAPGHPLRNVILSMKEESVADGTWEEPSADYGTTLYAADFRSEWETFKNNPLRPSLTPRNTTIGMQLQRFNWEAEIGSTGLAASETLATGVPQWAVNCPGMTSEQGEQWDVSADSGTPIPGEKFLESSLTHGFYFFKIIGASGAATQVVGIEIGTIAVGTTFTGEVSGASFTTDATLNTADYCVIHHPVSAYTARSIGLLYHTAATEYTRIAAAGCRGTWGLSCTRGQTVRLQCEALGVFQQDECKEVTVAAASIIYDPYQQLGFKGTGFFTAYGQAVADTVFSTFELTLGNPLAARENANIDTGAVAVMHGPGGREPTGSFDPELAIDGSSDELWATQAATQGIFEFALGSVADDIYEVKVGRATITGYDGGDRGPVKIAALPFDVAGAGSALEYEVMIGTR